MRWHAWRRWCRDERVDGFLARQSWREAKLAHIEPPRADSPLWERITEEHTEALRAAARRLSARPIRSARAVLAEARVLEEQQIRGSGGGETE